MSMFSRTAMAITVAALFGPLASVASADPLERSRTDCAITDVSPGATACFGWYSGNTSQHTTEILALLRGAVPGSIWTDAGKADAGSAQSGPFKPFAANSIKNFDDADLEFLFPQTGLFAVALKAGNEFGIYLFSTDASLSQISIDTPNNKALSNATLFTGMVPDPNIVVPEPSTYAMMLAGLAGLGAAARRRRKV